MTNYIAELDNEYDAQRVLDYLVARSRTTAAVVGRTIQLGQDAYNFLRAEADSGDISISEDEGSFLWLDNYDYKVQVLR